MKTAFAQFVTLQRGFDLPKANMRDGPYPVVGSTSIIGYHDKYKVEPPGVVTGRSGSLGTVQFIDEPYWPHNTSLWVKDFKGNHPRFVYYLLQGLDFARFNAGAGVPTLNRNHLDTLEVDVPSLPMQRRIAGILSGYDDLIGNSQRRIKILEVMARALYREWFVNFRFPGHEDHPRVASPLGEIPNGWEVISIEDVCELVTDGSHSSPKSVEEGMPMASSKDMHDWGLTMETCRFISRADFDSLVRNGCKPLRNDVLITKDGANYLKYIFVNSKESDVVLLSSIAILRPNTRINPYLLAAILKSPENKGRLKNYVTGAAIPRIVLKDFKRFQFVLPSRAVQRRWAQIAEPLAEQCLQLVEKIQILRRTRDLLLPRLLSGRVDLEAA
jgi:type I restriction enzyme S subunit